MLILSRRPDERILVGDDVVITVVKLGKTEVRIGIDAPRNVRVLREELLNKQPNRKRVTDDTP